jgi:2-dehydro-3-deoxyphosphogluconate aldolase/(4S)-4-hydroxy-2-oxoglutarate aldolase
MTILDLSPVVPVVVLDDVDAAVPVARALVDGGIRVIELTLRTPVALASIERIAAEVPEIVVGAGTVVDPDHAKAAAAAGAQFLVSPGSTPALLDAMTDTGLTVLPGCATISEVLALRERGITEVKFFPAQASGGAPFLAAVHGPLPGIRFCPTGGITPANAPDYLALPNVGCVGGSWLTPAEAVREGDWHRITALASSAHSLLERGALMR